LVYTGGRRTSATRPTTPPLLLSRRNQIHIDRPQVRILRPDFIIIIVRARCECRYSNRGDDSRERCGRSKNFGGAKQRIVIFAHIRQIFICCESYRQEKKKITSDRRPYADPSTFQSRHLHPEGSFHAERLSTWCDRLYSFIAFRRPACADIRRKPPSAPECRITRTS